MSQVTARAVGRRLLRPANWGKAAAAVAVLGVSWSVYINADTGAHKRWRDPPTGEDGLLNAETLLKEWTPPTRKQVIEKLKSTIPTKEGDSAKNGSQEFDVLIVGGGATGAGCALDAATRGLKVALVERDDYASGTWTLFLGNGRLPSHSRTWQSQTSVSAPSSRFPRHLVQIHQDASRRCPLPGKSIHRIRRGTAFSRHGSTSRARNGHQNRALLVLGVRPKLRRFDSRDLHVRLTSAPFRSRSPPDCRSCFPFTSVFDRHYIGPHVGFVLTRSLRST